MNLHINPWDCAADNKCSVEDLLKKRAPHGTLISCGLSSYARPNTAIQMWNNDSSHWIEAARTDAGEILTVIDKPQGGSRVVTDYRPPFDVLSQIADFVEKKNLPALAELRSGPTPTGGILMRSIVLKYADPKEEFTIDCFALDRYDLDDLEASLSILLQDAVKKSTVISRTETPIITPEAKELLAQNVPHGMLSGCVYSKSPCFDKAGTLGNYAQTITVAKTDGGETVTVEERGPFRHTNATVYRPATDILSEIEALADKENLPALCELRPPQNMPFGGCIGIMNPNVHAIDLTFDASADNGTAGMTKRVDLNLIAQHGLGFVSSALEAIFTDAIAHASVLSETEEINDVVRRVETLRQQREPHGALKRVVYLSDSPGSGPVNASFGRYEIARTGGDTILTVIQKPQYRNKATTVYRLADDAFNRIEAFAEEENLAAFSALKSSKISHYSTKNTVTLTYEEPAGEKQVDADALQEHGIGSLSGKVYQMIMDAMQTGTLLSTTWTCQVCGTTGNTTNACPTCGTKKDVVITTAPPAAQPTKHTTDEHVPWRCPNCGKETGGRFCMICGTPKPKENA